MVPGSPGRVIALPPSAITRVSGMDLIFDLAIGHGQGHDGLGGVQAIFGLLVDHRIRPIDHLAGNFVAAVGGERMHVESVGPRQRHARNAADPVQAWTSYSISRPAMVRAM